MRWSLLSFVVVLALSASGCTEEPVTPIDLGATTTTAPPVTGVPLPENDPNADARQQVIDLAIEECREDPTREFGVVIIADENGVEVNRYEHPCDEVDVDADSDASDGSE